MQNNSFAMQDANGGGALPCEKNCASAPVRSGALSFIASLVGELHGALAKKSVTIFFSATEVFYANRL